MATQPKTTKTASSVDAFVAKISPASKKADTQALIQLFERAIGAPAKVWGSSILGFGDSSYSNSSGKEVPWFVGGFVPRAKNFALYVAGGLEASRALLPKLGEHSASKGCLYIRALEDVDAKVLEAIVRATVKGQSTARSATNAKSTAKAKPTAKVKR